MIGENFNISKEIQYDNLTFEQIHEKAKEIKINFEKCISAKNVSGQNKKDNLVSALLNIDKIAKAFFSKTEIKYTEESSEKLEINLLCNSIFKETEYLIEIVKIETIKEGRIHLFNNIINIIIETSGACVNNNLNKEPSIYSIKTLVNKAKSTWKKLQTCTETNQLNEKRKGDCFEELYKNYLSIELLSNRLFLYFCTNQFRREPKEVYDACHGEGTYQKNCLEKVHMIGNTLNFDSTYLESTHVRLEKKDIFLGIQQRCLLLHSALQLAANPLAPTLKDIYQLFSSQNHSYKHF